MNSYIKLLQANHNIVLTGAPGTGKTYLAKQIAAQMILGKPYSEELEKNETFKNCCKFVQFHPSYDYTDFVEGLRPKSNENGNIGFDRRDGVFKAFCKKALKNWIDSQKSEKELQQIQSLRDRISDFLSESIENNTEFKTISGTKFFVKDISEANILISIPENKISSEIKVSQNDLFELLDQKVPIAIVKDIRKHFGRQFNTQQDSYTFILCNEIRKIKDKTKSDIVQSVVPRENFVFIIDEINRGEISKIFGELFFAIDPSYRGEKGLVQTQYQNMIEDGDTFKKGFYVPENVYIIGTMNDIDRSVESMDFAMRRRFLWKEITAVESAENMNLPEESKERMKRLNEEISKIEGLNSAYHIGGAYFLKLQNDNYTDLWNYHLEPLLKEYLRGQSDEAEKLQTLKNAYDLKSDNN
ncbi:MAG: endonuclease [Sphingobacteriia bacterium]|nr:endonuclease [Sphingobacteriia bacterium]